MKRLWPQSIRSRLIALIVFTIVPLFLIGTGLTVYFIHKDLRQSQLREIMKHLRYIALDIEHTIESARSDVRFLAACPPTGGLIRTWANNGIDPWDGGTETHWLGRMNQIFTAAVETKAIYGQVRFLDRNGREVVRVDLKNGLAVPVAGEQLQNKGDRYYFIETARLVRGQCYVSTIDFNQELGKIEIPHKPVMRVATPVFDEPGQFQGIVIINMLFSEVLKPPLVRHTPPLREQFYRQCRGILPL